jgi:endonuclease G
MKRGGWRLDPRIPDTAQIMKECYGNAPKFSRGHMTRREDPIWGTQEEASLGNSDSMHVTNTVPQMQNMNAGIWLALENYALQNARKDDQRISVFTGPVFKPSDPERFGVTIPISFWKVIAFIHDDTGKLCATGYTISQEEFLQEEEFVFGKHKTAQVSIRSIEKNTGLSFGQLGALDPFETATEALAGPVAPLQALTEIRFV